MEPPTRDALPSLISDAGKDPSIVSLYGALDNFGLVIDSRPEGWVVFYTERGGEFDLRTHPSEHAACEDVLERLGVGRMASREELPSHGYFGPSDLLALAREIAREVRPSARLSLTRRNLFGSRVRWRFGPGFRVALARRAAVILVEDGAARFEIFGRTGASLDECSTLLRGLLMDAPTDLVATFNLYALDHQAADDVLREFLDDEDEP